MQVNSAKIRYPIIDSVRGLAVLLMIVFHLAYDINYFKLLDFGFYESEFWRRLPHLIVTLFFISVGVSLALVHCDKIDWSKIKKRSLILVGYSLLISLGSYLFDPARWIYFGTLHSIAVCSLMALPLLKRPNLALAIAVSLLLMELFDKRLPWFHLDQPSLDYIPVFPWFFAVCLGIFIFHKKWHRVQFSFYFFEPLFQFLGKNALIVYLIHQPILFALTYLVASKV